MSHGLKLLLIAAGAIITCIVVVVGFQLTKSGKGDTNEAKEQYTGITNEYDDVKLTSFDDSTISGAEVVKCIQDNGTLLTSSSMSFSIKVVTAMNATGVEYGDDYESSLSTNTSVGNSTKADYINPLGKFKGSITRNDNGVIYLITFTQMS